MGVVKREFVNLGGRGKLQARTRKAERWLATDDVHPHRSTHNLADGGGIASARTTATP
ncbi:hypothetical protein QHI69_02705 [Burkholderia gladioli pv. gladioli]|uniref:hypothetical protein n=1 Tax=Burkholderia gladioli TaxID=28095 RepID=UPI0024BD151B|nr:hypothetical protein [Burkholderia gladioli]MDJ1160812.1 hypothetical protein [Burkholderia gladioli pv. gladioli]